VADSTYSTLCTLTSSFPFLPIRANRAVKYLPARFLFRVQLKPDSRESAAPAAPATLNTSIHGGASFINQRVGLISYRPSGFNRREHAAWSGSCSDLGRSLAIFAVLRARRSCQQASSEKRSDR
jgi:hypothetical protein